MTLTDRIDLLCIENGIENKSQLSKKSGVPYTTIDSMYRIGFDNVKLSTLERLAACLNTTLEYLVNGDPTENDIPRLSPAALRVARVYDSLPESGKRALDAFCDYVEDRG